MMIGRPGSSGLRSGEYRGVVWLPWRAFQRVLSRSDRLTPERCVEVYLPQLQRTQFERSPSGSCGGGN